MTRVRVYRINTGSCGGCDEEIRAALANDPQFSWASSAQDADALLLTGPMTVTARQALVQALDESPLTPVIAVGMCALTGAPFGRGGVQAFSSGHPNLIEVDGCPPQPETIVETLYRVLRLV